MLSWAMYSLSKRLHCKNESLVLAMKALALDRALALAFGLAFALVLGVATALALALALVFALARARVHLSEAVR